MKIQDILTKSAVKDVLYAHGFDVVRTLSSDDVPNISDDLIGWLEAGFHGDMGWMMRGAEKRADLSKKIPSLRSLFMVGINYYDADIHPLDRLEHRDCGAISIYAHNKDYHDIMKKNLKKVARWLEDTYKIRARLCVDTAPIHEKSLAQKSGIGWQGKHTNIVSKEFGSWLFLGALLLEEEFEPDTPEQDHCGSCHKCVDACPTDAFISPYKMDARRCISYLTIEYKGVFPRDLAKKMKNYIYGCDICLAVCPWNKFAQMANEAGFYHRDELHNPPLSQLVGLKDAEFRKLFSKSPIKRIGRDRFIRNVLNAIGNLRDPEFAPLVRPLLTDEAYIVRKTADFTLKDILS